MHPLFSTLALVLGALGLVGCSSASTAPTTPSPAAPVTTTEAPPKFAPQLFTVDQLRDGNPPGRVIELRVELDGKPTTIQRLELTGGTATDATIRATTRDEAGKVLEDTTATTAWAELSKHGQFPADATTFEDNVRVTVPAGTFTTRLYTVKAGAVTRQFWFASELPGPPVQFTVEQAGKVSMRAQMLRAK